MNRALRISVTIVLLLSVVMVDNAQCAKGKTSTKKSSANKGDQRIKNVQKVSPALSKMICCMNILCKKPNVVENYEEIHDPKTDRIHTGNLLNALGSKIKSQRDKDQCFKGMVSTTIVTASGHKELKAFRNILPFLQKQSGLKENHLADIKKDAGLMKAHCESAKKGPGVLIFF